MSRILARALLVLAAAVAAGPPAGAEPAAPAPALSLTARERGVDDPGRVQPLRLAALDVSVRIHGRVADTIVTARFENPGESLLEGDFTLLMPTGSVVTGYALDVGERLVDGVLVDQRKARRVYRERVRERVDPGLAEISRAFEFRTHVYPIAAGKGRTIRLRFTSPLEPGIGYVLPLGGGIEAGRLTVAVSVSGVERAPRLVLPDGGRAAVSEDGEKAWRSGYEARSARLSGPLAVEPGEPSRPMAINADSRGETWFDIADRTPDTKSAAVAAPAALAILWDRSASRADDALEREIALASAYVDRVRPASVELVLFDSGPVERISLPEGRGLADRLRAVRYRGATSVATLSLERIEAASCLLFTDGLVTIDRREALRPGCPVFAIATAPDADRAWLSALARATGGEAIRLGSRNGADVLDRLARPGWRLFSARAASGAAIDFIALDAPAGGWRIVGPMPRTGDVIVRFASADGRTSDRIYSAPREDAPRMDGVEALWAADTLALRGADDDSDRAALLEFARRHSVSGPDISFLVLETPADYARAGIEPPLTLPKDQREEYERLAVGERAKEREKRQERLATLVTSWEEQKAWWAKGFDPHARPPKAARSAGEPPAPPPPSPPMEAPPPPVAGSPEPPAAASGVVEVESAERAEVDDGNIVVTGTRIASPNLNSTSPVAVVGNDEIDLPPTKKVEVAEWSPDRPYLTALKAAKPEQRERVLAEQQAKYGALPAFWLDVSEFYYRARDAEAAKTLLLSALDLPTRDSETVAIVAQRLLRYGDPDRAIFLLERLMAAEGDRPQPARDLALALARRAEARAATDRPQAKADYARAIALLTDVIMTPWDGAYEGIELIALMEVNRLIPRYRALGGTDVALDPRLIKLLDVDLRVVMEWNSEATDLDLWVDEPNGERAIYSNPATAIGGRLSNDMTSGYGPEEYLLRRAIPGAFVVRTNVYAPDRLNPNGASRLTAHLIRDFGRPNEHEEVVDVEMLPDEKQSELLIGRIVVNR